MAPGGAKRRSTRPDEDEDEYASPPAPPPKRRGGKKAEVPIDEEVRDGEEETPAPSRTRKGVSTKGRRPPKEKQEKEKKSPEERAEAARQKFDKWKVTRPQWAHLRLGTVDDRLSLDQNEPSSFTEFDVGNADQWLWKGAQLFEDDEEVQQCLSNTEKAMSVIVHGRKAQVESDTDAESATFAARHAKQLKAADADKLVTELLEIIPVNTRAVLGRGAFTVTSLRDMATFRRQDLKDSWVVYLGVIVPPLGKFKVYVGSATDQNGSGTRLIDGYEKAIRKARMGICDATFQLSHFCQAAALPGHKASLRPILVMQIPPEESERVAARSLILLGEGLITDYMQSQIMDGKSRPITFKNRTWETNSSMHEKLSKDLQPRHWTKTWEGVNRVNPIHQGQGDCGFGRPEWVIDGIASLEQMQGDTKCPVCREVDLETNEVRYCSLHEEVEWMDHEITCEGCGHWLRGNNADYANYNWAVQECGSLIALQERRAGTRGSGSAKVAKRSAMLSVTATECPICHVVLVRQDPGETWKAALVRLGKVEGRKLMRAISPAIKVKIRCFAGESVLCHGCETWHRNLLANSKGKYGASALQNLRRLESFTTIQEASVLRQEMADAKW